jgi:hypothetical protein
MGEAAAIPTPSTAELEKATRYLVAVAGPPIEPIQLTAKPEGLTLGRHANCDLLLPADAERVFDIPFGELWERLAPLAIPEPSLN